MFCPPLYEVMDVFGLSTPMGTNFVTLNAFARLCYLDNRMQSAIHQFIESKVSEDSRTHYLRSEKLQSELCCPLKIKSLKIKDKRCMVYHCKCDLCSAVGYTCQYIHQSIERSACGDPNYCGTRLLPLAPLISRIMERSNECLIVVGKEIETMAGHAVEHELRDLLSLPTK